MELKNLVAIAGMPGIFKVISNKGGGIIVEDLKNQKRQFVPARQGVVTPLESIFIYIEDGEQDTAPLKDIYQSMLNQVDNTPVPPAKSDDKAIKAYFQKAVPNLDKERVYVSDMKKMLKWYHFLDELGILTAIETPSEPTETVENIESAETQK